ncbi:hypothetical protein LZ30DRAFT_752661 [Colletotrichum cereale]|nr:hypothetical protein LZ30DRAFT_752661 [Colletotrichum cereale]
MVNSSQHNGNADAASTTAEQGSAYNDNPHVPNTAEDHTRLGLFLPDIELQGCSSDHAGTVEHHDARAHRVASVVTVVSQLLPNEGGSEPAGGQANANRPTDLQGIGAQFDE